jgi:hypothetical protein
VLKEFWGAQACSRGVDALGGELGKQSHVCDGRLNP